MNRATKDIILDIIELYKGHCYLITLLIQSVDSVAKARLANQLSSTFLLPW